MRIARWKVTQGALLLGLALACGLGIGCGGGDRMQTGTQVEVSDQMLEEAAAQDAYFDEQAKTR